MLIKILQQQIPSLDKFGLHLLKGHHLPAAHICLSPTEASFSEVYKLSALEFPI